MIFLSFIYKIYITLTLLHTQKQISIILLLIQVIIQGIKLVPLIQGKSDEPGQFLRTVQVTSSSRPGAAKLHHFQIGSASNRPK